MDPTPSNPVMGDGVLVAMRQKAVRFDDRRLLLWAGNPIVARRVWTALDDAIRHGWDYSIPNLIETLDLTENEKSDIHLILHDITDRGLNRQIYMCKGAKVDEQETWFMGSGDRHFIDYTVPVFPDQEGSDAVKFIRPWLNRLGSVFLDEALDQSNFQHRYGTWFEVAWYDDGKLKKVPYLIKLWRAVGDEISSLPTFACWYLDDHLCIARTRMQPGPQTEMDCLAIGDPLARTPIPTEDTLLTSFCPPNFQIHIVFDAEWNFAVIPVPGDWSQFQFAIDGRQINWRSEAELRRFLLDKLNGGTQGRIVRPE